MKMLVIEDHPAELKLAHNVLSHAGHHVNDAETAQRGVASLANDRPDVILLDLGLPDEDGVALIRELKGASCTRAIPIMAVTSYPERYSMKAALSAGCETYRLKPLNTRTLAAELSALAQTGTR